MLIRRIFLFSAYVAINLLTIAVSHAVQKNIMKDGVNDASYKHEMHCLTEYFPVVIAQIIESYSNPLISFLPILKRYENGICYSSFKGKSKPCLENGFKLRRSIGYCRYNPYNRRLELIHESDHKKLLSVYNEKMHECLKNAMYIFFAPLNDNFLIIMLVAYQPCYHEGGNYLILPILENNTECIVSIPNIHIQCFVQNNEEEQILLVHSTANDYDCMDQSKIMTRILFRKNNESSIESYYLPHYESSQYCYEVKKSVQQKNVIFLFGIHPYQHKFYIIFTQPGNEPLCAEFSCDFIAPSEVQDSLIIGINNESYKNSLEEDYFVKRSDEKIEYMQPINIYTLKRCQSNFFECTDVDLQE